MMSSVVTVQVVEAKGLPKMGTPSVVDFLVCPARLCTDIDDLHSLSIFVCTCVCARFSLRLSLHDVFPLSLSLPPTLPFFLSPPSPLSLSFPPSLSHCLSPSPSICSPFFHLNTDLGTTGTVDPYVVLTFGKSKQRTKVKKGCFSPVWEEDFVFKGVAEDDVILFEVLLCVRRAAYFTWDSLHQWHMQNT